MNTWKCQPAWPADTTWSGLAFRGEDFARLTPGKRIIFWDSLKRHAIASLRKYRPADIIVIV